MKVLQVVTYISPDGAYGGPVRVAINQAKALTDLGHDVVVAAAAGGFDGPLPTDFDGFPVRLFPARRLVPKSGFAGLASPGLFSWLARAVHGADVIHVHLARDLVTLPAAALALLIRKPLIVQTHGMIDRTDNPLAVPLDRFLTRPVLRRARTVFHLTNRERQDLRDVAGEGLELAHLPNGVAIPEAQAIEQRIGPQANPEVLYLARLHSIKRPTLMVEAARALCKKHSQALFTLVGPDEGQAIKVQSATRKAELKDKVIWAGAIPPDQTLNRMRSASIYVLPSSAEVLPMAVLEAMSVGLPVVVTDGCGLAPMIEARSAGLVCGQSAEDFAEAIGTLLDDPDRRVAMGANARRAVTELHSVQRIAKSLGDTYGAVSGIQEVGV